MAGSSGKTGKDRIEEAATNVGHRAQEAATQVGHRAQEAASSLAHRAQEAGSSVAQQASTLAAQASEKADDALSRAGQGMTSLAGQVRQNMPQEGVLGSASSAVADRLREGGQYLQQHGVGDIADDMGGLVRRHPLPALCIGFGVGFLLGMVLTRRS
jgi:ElaB/YqjD/DUF883 family membrane-anchored ribosome-binding protein